MAVKLQKEFMKYHEAIKLNDIEDNKVLRDKRDTLLDELRAWLKKNNKPTFAPINQGSYAMGTGVKPIGNRDYDIDVGLKFNLDVEDYEPVKVKEWVYEALSGSNRTVEMMRPCVRVQYHKNGEEAYHVDLAVYGNCGEQLQLAKGYSRSDTKLKKWEDADPEKLKQLLHDKFTDEDERLQFKRIIRYLKRWKAEQFSASGEAEPKGIAMTAMACQWFEPVIRPHWNDQKLVNDFKALNDLLQKICQNNCGIDVKLPVAPSNKLFDRMSDRQKETYKSKMKAFKDAIKTAFVANEKTAAKELRKYLGDDFPDPKKVGVVKSSESA